jgi:hypothetical protein
MNDQEQLEFVSRISGLICRYLRQEITDPELRTLYAWAYASKANQDLFEELSDIGSLQTVLSSWLEIDREGALREILRPLTYRSPMSGS